MAIITFSYLSLTTPNLDKKGTYSAFNTDTAAPVSIMAGMEEFLKLIDTQVKNRSSTFG
jgi:hypothetical protein